MRLGAPVGNWNTLEEWAQLHIEKGYGAAYCPIDANADDRTCEELKNVCQRHDLVLSEVGAWCNPFDAQKGEENIQYIIGQLRLADKIGARCCVNISGSLSPIWDGPHVENLTQRTFDAIVKTTQRIIDEAAPQNAAFALEPMPWMYPTDANSMEQLLKAVNRKQFHVHVDMCNMINSYEKTLQTGALTRDFFARFGNKIGSVHLKDTIVTPCHLTLHIDEAIPGQGIFDHGALLQECAKLPDVPVMLEHLASLAEYDEARIHVEKVARENGLSFTRAK